MSSETFYQPDHPKEQDQHGPTWQCTSNWDTCIDLSEAWNDEPEPEPKTDEKMEKDRYPLFRFIPSSDRGYRAPPPSRASPSPSSLSLMEEDIHPLSSDRGYRAPPPSRASQSLTEEDMHSRSSSSSSDYPRTPPPSRASPPLIQRHIYPPSSDRGYRAPPPSRASPAPSSPSLVLMEEPDDIPSSGSSDILHSLLPS